MSGNPWVAIALAGLAAWVFGAAWYMLLGKSMQRALGQDPAQCEGKKMPLVPLAVCLVAEWVMAGVIYQTLVNLGVMGWQDGAIAGVTLGVGLLLMPVLVGNLFTQRKFALTVIDGGHWVLVAVIEGLVIGAFL